MLGMNFKLNQYSILLSMLFIRYEYYKQSQIRSLKFINVCFVLKKIIKYGTRAYSNCANYT